MEIDYVYGMAAKQCCTRAARIEKLALFRERVDKILELVPVVRHRVPRKSKIPPRSGVLRMVLVENQEVNYPSRSTQIQILSRRRSCIRASIGTPSRTARKHIAPGNHCEFHGQIPRPRQEIRTNIAILVGKKKPRWILGKDRFFAPANGCISHQRRRIWP